MIALFGCSSPEAEVPPHASSARIGVEVLVHRLPTAPDDPVVMEVRRGAVVKWPAEPVVLGPDGEEVVMTELRSGDRVDGWVAVGGFAPGPHEIVSAGGVELAHTFWISAFGVDAVDASSLVGRAWQLMDGLALPAPATELVWATLEEGPGVFFVVDEVSGSEVLFRVVVGEGESACTALRDRATFDGPNLVWNVDEVLVEVPATAGNLPVTVRDVVGRMEWANLEGAAWAMVQGVADFLEFEGSGLEVCAVAATVGGPCQACPTGESESCLYVGGTGIDLWETDVVPPIDLPMCGIDRLDTDLPEIGPIACGFEGVDLDLTCGCRVLGPRATLPALMVGAMLALRRRRAPVRRSSGASLSGLSAP